MGLNTVDERMKYGMDKLILAIFTIMSKSEYNSIHMWLRYKFGKATHCENQSCKKNSTRFEWALRKGFKYERDRCNFIMLCKKCHIEYDGHHPELLHSLRDGETMERIQQAKYKPIAQVDINGVIVKEWKSTTHASIALGISRTAISNNLLGHSKTAGGFIWILNG